MFNFKDILVNLFLKKSQLRTAAWPFFFFFTILIKVFISSGRKLCFLVLWKKLIDWWLEFRSERESSLSCCLDGFMCPFPAVLTWSSSVAAVSIDFDWRLTLHDMWRPTSLNVTLYLTALMLLTSNEKRNVSR